MTQQIKWQRILSAQTGNESCAPLCLSSCQLCGLRALKVPDLNSEKKPHNSCWMALCSFTPWHNFTAAAAWLMEQSSTKLGRISSLYHPCSPEPHVTHTSILRSTLPARVMRSKAQQVTKALFYGLFLQQRLYRGWTPLLWHLLNTATSTNVTVATAQTRVWAAGWVIRETMMNIW